MYITLLYLQHSIQLFLPRRTQNIARDHKVSLYSSWAVSFVYFVVHPCSIKFRIPIAIGTVTDTTNDDIVI